MATFTWVGGSTGNATDDANPLNPNNWQESGAPSATGTDDLVFKGTAASQCALNAGGTWECNSIKIESDCANNRAFVISGTVTLKANTNALVIHKEKCVYATSGKITFTGHNGTSTKYVYFVNTTNMQTEALGMFADDSSRNAIEFNFAPSAGCTILMEDGVYPDIHIDMGSNDVQFSPTYCASSSTNTYGFVDILGFQCDARIAPKTHTESDLGKKFSIEGTVVLNCDTSPDATVTNNRNKITANWGFATVKFTPTSSGFYLPVTGDVNFGTQNYFSTKYFNLEIGKSTTSDHRVLMRNNVTLYCNSLKVDSGAKLYAEGNFSDMNCTEIHTVQRPNILGDWNFVQVADGVYRSRGSPERIPVTSGGTGLDRVSDLGILYGDAQGSLDVLDFPTSSPAGKVLAVNSSGNGLEWSATAGGGGLSTLDMNDTDSGFTWGTNDISTITTLKLVAGNNISLNSDTSAKAVRITATDTNTFRPVEVDTNGDGSADETLGGSDTLRLKKGSNISLTESSGVVVISGAYSEATTSAEGLMSTAHHDKLDGIEASATADQTATEIIGLLNSDLGGNFTIGNQTDDRATFTGGVTSLDLKTPTITTASGALSIDAAGDNNITIAGAGDTRVTIGHGTISPAGNTGRLNIIHDQSSGATGPALQIVTKDADQHSGPNLNMYRDSSSPADNDQLAKISFQGVHDGTASGGTQGIHTFAQILAVASDVSDGTEDGYLTYYTSSNGTNGEVFRMGATNQSFNHFEVKTGSQLRLFRGDNSYKVSIKASSSLGADYTLTLPTTDGNANEVLKTDGAGVLSWVAQTADTNDDVSVANLKTRLAGGFGSNAVQIGDSDDVVTIPGSLVVTGTTTTNNVETISTSGGIQFESNATGVHTDKETLLTGVTGLTSDITVTLPSSTGTIALQNENTSGTAAGLSATLAVASGGTGVTANTTWLNANITSKADGTLNYDGTTAVAPNHDSLAGFVAAEHYRWDNDISSTATIDGANVTFITVSDNNEADETVYPVFVDGATGSQALETETKLSYKPDTGVLTSTAFAGALTGNVTGDVSGSSGSCTGNAATATTATTATNVVVTDNENTDEDNAIVFTAGGDVDGSTSIGLESDGDLTYNPSTGQVSTGMLKLTSTTNDQLVVKYDSDDKFALHVGTDRSKWRMADTGGTLRDVISIQENGTATPRVGIHQSSPTAPLHVGGEIKSTSATVSGQITGQDIYATRFNGVNNSVHCFTDGFMMGATAPDGTFPGEKHSDGSFSSGFQFTSNAINGGASDWANGGALPLCTVHIGNNPTSSPSLTDVFGSGKIKVVIQIVGSEASNHNTDIKWSQTSEFLALGGGDYNANSIINWANSGLFGIEQGGTIGSTAPVIATNKFDISWAITQIGLKNYAVLYVKNMSGGDILRADGNAFLITGSLVLEKALAVTG